MKEVPEQTTITVRATFTDDDDPPNLVTPSSMSYRLDDMTGGVATQVIANTTVTPSTTYHDIVIAAANNVVLDQSHEYEERLLTVKFIYGSKQGTGEYSFLVKNMRRIETLLGA